MRRYQIYLGMEEREANGTEKALGLIQMFVKSFRSIDFTTHPAGIPGESAGKGSNLGWAARKLSEKYPMSVRENVIVTGIDGKWTMCSKVVLHRARERQPATTLRAAYARCLQPRALRLR